MQLVCFGVLADVFREPPTNAFPPSPPLGNFFTPGHGLLGRLAVSLRYVHRRWGVEPQRLIRKLVESWLIIRHVRNYAKYNIHAKNLKHVRRPLSCRWNLPVAQRLEFYCWRIMSALGLRVLLVPELDSLLIKRLYAA
jgi:hypothetical protein